MKEQLEVGDVLYEIGRSGNIVTTLTIKRVTANYAICERKNYSGESFEVKFQRQFKDDYIRYVDRDKWAVTTWKLESTKLKELAARQKLLGEIKKIEFESLSTETLQAIKDLTK